MLKQILKSAYVHLEPIQILQSPTAVLLGVSEKTAALINQALNIRTVVDLATSHVFSNASLLVRSAEGEATIYAKCGVLSSDVFDSALLSTASPVFSELVINGIEVLNGIGPHTSPLLKEALDVSTIRDLAYWPPYVNACKVVQTLAGASAAADTDGTPADLLPVTGQYPTERTQYNMLVFDRLISPSPMQPIENGIRLDVMAAQDMLARENTPALGALLSYTQSWYSLGLSLGQLLHSIALAPGESTRVAILDWHRRVKSQVTETEAETDVLTSSLVRSRSLNEVVNAVASEFQNGKAHTYTSAESENFGVGFGTGMGAGAMGGGSYNLFSGVAGAGDSTGIGLSYGTASGSGSAWTWSSTQGRRDVASNLAQRVVDETHQNSMMARDRWASIVREVSQSERETLSTRAITNFNHMHAMTVQYYEVVQIYRVVVELSKITRCIFVPMQQLDFESDRVIKAFRTILARAARSAVVRLLASAELGSLFLRFPKSRAVDRQAYLDWASTNETTVDFVGTDTVVIPDETRNYAVMEFRFYNPENATPSDYVFSSIIVDLQDGRSPEFALKPDVGTIQSVKVSDAFVSGFVLRLSEIKRIMLRKSTAKASFSGPTNNIDLIIGAADNSGSRRFLYGEKLNVPAAPEAFAAWELTPYDRRAWAQLKAELTSNRLYYSQAVWQHMDSATLTHMLSTYTFAGHPLLNVIDANPVGVAGCYLVFSLNLDDPEWQRYLHATGLTIGARQESVVPLPSGGVFSEAVLGRANSAEKLDLTRFWNWSDSPIPITASEIAPLTSASRVDAALETEKPQGFGAPFLNIVNPPAMPDPTGMVAALAAIQNGNMFRDMSGLTGAISLAQAGLASAMQAAEKAAGTAADEAKTAMQQASKNLATAAEAFENVYGKGGAKGGAASVASGGSNAPSTISNLGAKFNAAEKLDRESSSATGSKAGAGSVTKQQSSEPASGASATGAGATTRRDEVLGFGGGAIAQAAPAGSNQSVATDASAPGYFSIASDHALLDSDLATAPGFSDVEGFIFLLQAANESDVIPLLIRRFDSVAAGVSLTQKYGELVNGLQRLRGSLESYEQLLFAAQFVKNGIWPDASGFGAAAIAGVKDQAIHLMTQYVLANAQSVNPDAACYDIVSSVLRQAYACRVYDINHVAYMLATAHHESRMGYWMLERAPANYSPADPDFARDAYFFDRRPGKASYNGVNGNLLAGDQLMARNVITEADKAVWNGTVYPHEQSQDVKLAARDCDFYQFSGKGLVQVTGRGNYQRYSGRPELNNENFVSNPDKVTEFEYAAGILVLGVEFGYCSAAGRRLSDYDNNATHSFDAFNARDIVNGDKHYFPHDAEGNPIGTESFGQRIRRIAQQYKRDLLQFPVLDESRRMV